MRNMENLEMCYVGSKEDVKRLNGSNGWSYQTHSECRENTDPWSECSRVLGEGERGSERGRVKSSTVNIMLLGEIN